jgi:hypothetical protein
MIELTISLAEATCKILRQMRRSPIVLQNGLHGVATRFVWHTNQGH